MANCDLCGIKPAKFNAEIEGTMMAVCEDCARFGKVKVQRDVKIVFKEAKKPEMNEPIYSFVEGYGMIVKAAREKLGLKQDEMAKRLNERESTLHQIESEHLKPSIMLARKLERMLHIKIVEEEKATNTASSNKIDAKSTGMTFGDMMKK